jgi:hypothetical protein
MSCPLCQKRPSKRFCPAKEKEICTVCCATKRLVEIACPEDCRYQGAAQRHPAAVVRKQIDHDLSLLMGTVGRLSEQQLQLFFLIQTLVLAYKPEGLGRITDADVALSVGALAASLETASKGVIFDEALTSIPAEGLRRALKPAIEEITKAGGARAEREVAMVLRSVERGASHAGGHIPDGQTTYLELVGRVFQDRPLQPRASAAADKQLIILP